MTPLKRSMPSINKPQCVSFSYRAPLPYYNAYFIISREIRFVNICVKVSAFPKSKAKFDKVCKNTWGCPQVFFTPFFLSSVGDFYRIYAFQRIPAPYFALFRRMRFPRYAVKCIRLKPTKTERRFLSYAPTGLYVSPLKEGAKFHPFYLVAKNKMINATTQIPVKIKRTRFCVFASIGT